MPLPFAADGLPINESGRLTSVNCRSCGIDLSGLSIEANCPTCGLNARASADPTGLATTIRDFRLAATGLRCAGCEAPLAALRLDNGCPRCGLKVSVSADLALPGPDPLATDLICVQCGYNLRSLDRSGLCPECANPIRDTLVRRSTVIADPDWLQHLASASTTIAVSLTVLPFFLCPFACLGGRSGSTSTDPMTFSPLLPVLAFAIGCVRLTRLEPHTDRLTNPLRRPAGRVLLLGGLVLALMIGLVYAVLIRPSITGLMPGGAIATTIGSAIVAFLLVFLHYLRRLSERLHADTLALRFRVLAALVLFGNALPIFALILIPSFPPPPAYAALVDLISAFSIVLPITTYTLITVAQFALSRCLREAAATSRHAMLHGPQPQ